MMDKRNKLGRFKKGQAPWNKGKKLTKNHRKNLSTSHLGNKLKEETKRKLSNSLKGKKKPPFSIEHKKNISKGLQGNIPWNNGKVGLFKHSDKSKRKISIAITGKMVNEKNPNWKGEGASYSSFHKWINRKLGKPDTCDCCGANGLSGREIHWANKSGEYKRELSDWIRLCRECHSKYDNDKISPKEHFLLKNGNYSMRRVNDR